jgi:hypothetical protein
MRVVICGGREESLSAQDRAWLDQLVERHCITEVGVGGARGIDTQAEEWARSRKLRVVRFPAFWKEEGQSAGFRRNWRMGRWVEGGGMVVAFEGGRGTAHMVRVAQRLRVKVVRKHAAGPVSVPYPGRSPWELQPGGYAVV